MKSVIFALALVVSSAAFAQSQGQTHSQRRAAAMVAVLQSESLAGLLSQEDGVGNISGITTHRSVTQDAALYFKLSFVSRSFSGENFCSVIARVEGVDGSGQVTISKVECE